MKKNSRDFTKKILQFLAIFALIFAWIFSGWPTIWNFPPEIQEARADTDTYYGTYDSANSDMTNSSYAETDNTQYAYGDKNKKAVIQSWSGTAGSGAISGVRIYCQHYATTPDGNDFTLVDYSLDNWVSTGTTTGQQAMPGSEASFSVDITADRSPWNWTDIGNLEVRATAKASGKQNFTNDYIDVLYIQVDYTLISASVLPTSTDYGMVVTDLVRKADTANANDEFVVTNDGTVAEDFDIISSDATGGSGWTLSTTATGVATFMHAYSTLKTLTASFSLGSDQTSEWVALDKDPNYKPLAANVAVSGTAEFVLELLTPTDMNGDYNSKEITVTIRATQH